MEEPVKTLKAKLTDAAMRKAKKEVTKKMKNKAKKRMRRLRRGLLGGLFLFFAGCWVGVHRNVLLAWLRHEPLPQAPSWHFWVKSGK